MKRWNVFQSLMLATCMLLACTNEIMEVRPPVTGEENTIVFKLCSTEKNPETYAAVNGDDRVETLDVYMFNTDSEWLVSVFRFTAGELEQVDGSISVTIDVTGRVGEHRFYFVANAAGYASSLENARIGETTEEDFVFRLTDRRTEALTLPLLMTGYSKVAHIETPASGETSVLLRRRAARFDVKNNASETGLTIDQILVSNATLETYLFAGVHNPSIVPAKGNLSPVAYSSLPGANGEQTLKGVVYIYPTEISPSDMEDGLTKIWLEGILAGEKQILNIRSRFSAEANYSYVLKPSENLIYPGTNLPPVRVGNIYWAPVNVGVSGNNLTGWEPGSLFQWGRNVPFVYGVTSGTTYTGPYPKEQTERPPLNNSFIYGKTPTYDWIGPQVNNLWSGENAQGPCPPGWRVPTLEDFYIIYELYLNNDSRIQWDNTNKGYRIRGDDGISNLFFPTAGFRSGVSIFSGGRGVYGQYWSSDVSNEMALRLYFKEGTEMNVDGTYRVTGLSVRCIADK